MKRENGVNATRDYVDRWPAWLDLEELVYRPVIQTLLPAVCGAVCRAADRYLLSTMVAVLLAVSAVVCRAMDCLGDSLIRLARKPLTGRGMEAGESRAGTGLPLCWEGP